MIDRLEELWMKLNKRFPNLNRLVINADNGRKETVSVPGGYNGSLNSVIPHVSKLNWPIIRRIIASTIPLNDSGAFLKTIGEVNC